MSAPKILNVARQVKPILSIDNDEARKRVINLYKAWYRQIPYIVLDYNIPKSVEECKLKLREKFEQHKNVEDVRVVDMLVIKGQMQLKEIVNAWIQKHGIMKYWNESVDPKPQDFLSKFLEGHD